jgi:hypothetical protein
MEPARIEGHGPSGQGRLWLVPGQWALSLFKSAPLPENAYIEAVLWGDRRQSGPFVGVDQRGYSARIEVRNGFAAATISGTISNLDAKATVRPLVRAIAEPADGYGLDTSLPVGAIGDFHSNNLPPGTYVVYALSPRGRESDLYDPAVQARYANYAKRISLAPGETVRVELEAIP